jgi:hypothetical protein
VIKVNKKSKIERYPKKMVKIKIRMNKVPKTV